MDRGSLLDAFLRYASAHRLLPANGGERVIVACSGGRDSMLLLHFLAALRARGGPDLVPVHVNHLLRPSAGREAYLLCEEIERRYGLRLGVFSADVAAVARAAKRGVEETGRDIRRRILEHCAAALGADRIALGHHRDDQAETLLFRLARGTGLRGLAGMRPRDGLYVRPLLFSSRREIAAEVEKEKLFFIEDESNSSPEFARNRIRMQVLPALAGVNERAADHIAELAVRAQELEEHTVRLRCGIAAGALLFADEAFSVFDGSFLFGDAFTAKEGIRALFEQMTGGVRTLDRLHVDGFYEAALRRSSVSINFPGDLVFARAFDVIIVSRKNASAFGARMPLLPGCNAVPGGLGVFTVSGAGNTCEIRTFLPGDRWSGRKLKELFLEIRLPRQFRRAIPFVARGHDVLYLPLCDGLEKTVDVDGNACKISFQEGPLYSKIVTLTSKLGNKQEPL